jgi:hypothetical protein
VVTNILRSHFRNFRNHFRSFRNHFRNPSLFRRLYRFADASINCVGYLFVGVAEYFTCVAKVVNFAGRFRTYISKLELPVSFC